MALELERATPTSVFNSQSQAVLKFLHRVRAGESDAIWKHQAEAVISIADFLAKPNSTIGLCEIATGGGKSLIAVLSAYACNASRVLVITPSEQISRQLKADFVGSLDDPTDPIECCFVARGIVPALPDRSKLLPPCALVLDTSKINTYLLDPLMITNAHKIGGRSRVAIADIPPNYDLVIVDEAHHYPANTWKLLINHFPTAKRLFLTATPSHKGKDILPNQAQYVVPGAQFSRAMLQGIGIIRNMEFKEENFTDVEQGLVDGAADGPAAEKLRVQLAFKNIAARVKVALAAHDAAEPGVFHQAMIITQSIKTLNSAQTFLEVYNEGIVDINEKAQSYVSGVSKDVVKSFKKQGFRTLVIIGRLLEGFDNKQVSVVGIARNVQPKSRVLFNQFVGRAIRQSHAGDTVQGQIISHHYFGQQAVYDKCFEQLPEEDDPEAEDEAEDLDDAGAAAAAAAMEE